MKEKIKEYRQRLGISYLGNFTVIFIINLSVKELFDYFWATDNTFLENIIQSIILSIVLSLVFVRVNRNAIKKKSE